MRTKNMTGNEQFVRMFLALALIGFSFQDHTSVMHAIIGYLVGGVLLVSVLFAQCVTWKLLGRTEFASP
jgi:hypothetical protein